MSDTAVNWTPYQILDATNEGDYHPTSNPCGWNADGHEANLARWSGAVAAVGKEVRAAVATATAAGNQTGAWKRLEADGGAVVAPMRLAANSVSVQGDWTWLFVPGRAVRPGQASPESGWVLSSTYEAAANRTVVTVEEFTVPVGISEIWFGQDPANAPRNAESDPAQLEYLLW